MTDPQPGTPAPPEDDDDVIHDRSVRDVVERTRDVIRKTRELLDNSRELLERVRHREGAPPEDAEDTAGVPPPAEKEPEGSA